MRAKAMGSRRVHRNATFPASSPTPYLWRYLIEVPIGIGS
jgi:hypothetical protein